MRYNKLVRDKIPEIIKASGKSVHFRVAETTELPDLLKQKLNEEVAEFQKDENPEELADILEVIQAIATMHNLDLADLETLRAQKSNERGGFSKRIVLEEVGD